MQNMPRYYTVERQKFGLKRSDKMAPQKEPNWFALFTSSDLDFLENGGMVE